MKYPFLHHTQIFRTGLHELFTQHLHVRDLTNIGHSPSCVTWIGNTVRWVIDLFSLNLEHWAVLIRHRKAEGCFTEGDWPKLIGYITQRHRISHDDLNLREFVANVHLLWHMDATEMCCLYNKPISAPIYQSLPNLRQSSLRKTPKVDNTQQSLSLWQTVWKGSGESSHGGKAKYLAPARKISMYLALTFSRQLTRTTTIASIFGNLPTTSSKNKIRN